MSNETMRKKAELASILSVGFSYPTDEMAEALASGEFSEVLGDLLNECKYPENLATELLGGLEEFKSLEKDSIIHLLRPEYTRLFIGTPTPAVTPYEGIRKTTSVKKMQFVNSTSIAVEKAMKRLGIIRGEKENDPLDSINLELEFLAYIGQVAIGALNPIVGTIDYAAEFDSFKSVHIDSWAGDFADEVIETAKSPLYISLSKLLKWYVEL